MRRALITACLALAVSACGGDNPTSPSANVAYSTTDIRVGTGSEAGFGRVVAVDYTGWLYSATGPDNKGTQFDSSLTAGRDPLVMRAGGTDTIPGFSQAVVGMRVGGVRRVVIPPSLGYGAQTTGSIPGNSTLVFEIELLAIQPQ
jgi:FKBP-type peptidyl-prolyl cis-trans isomerase FkpA